MNQSAFNPIPESRDVRGSDKITILSARRSRSSACGIFFLLLTLTIMEFFGWMPRAYSEPYRPIDLNRNWVKAKADSFIVLLDTSYSMNEWHKWQHKASKSDMANTKLYIAKMFVTEMIQTFPKVKTTAGLRTFSGHGSELIYGITSVSPKKDFLEKIESISSGNVTKSLKQAISAALDDDVKKLAGKRINILIISDFSNINKDEEDNILKIIAQTKEDRKYGDVCFHAIQVGGSSSGKSLAARIGKTGVCKFQDCPDYIQAIQAEDFVADPQAMSKYILDVFLTWPLPPQADEKAPQEEFLLAWAVWAERSPYESLSPDYELRINNLVPGEPYLMTLALSALSRDRANSSLCDINMCGFEHDIKAMEGKPLTMKARVFVDSTYFGEPQPQEQNLTINIENMERYKKRELIYPYESFHNNDKKSSSPDFIFGDISFRMKVKSESPRETALVTIYLKSDDRIVGVINEKVCISDNATLSPCSTFERIKPVVETIGPHRLGATLSFIEIDGVLYGMFANNDTQDAKRVSWRIGQKVDDFRTSLSNWVEAFTKTRTSEKMQSHIGVALYNILFPSGEEGADRARRAFETFVRPYLVIDPAQKNYQAPTISVYFPRGADESPLLIPTGLIAIDDRSDYLGFHFKIVTPLRSSPLQIRTADCISRWVMLVPDRDRKDVALGIAFAQSKPALSRWEPHIREKDFFGSLINFGVWLSQGEVENNPLCIMILSHHTKDMIFFDRSDSPTVTATQITKRFSVPSVVILNGCGTGGPGAVEFVRQFSKRGMEAIIATSSEVDPVMAGDFLNCLYEALEKCTASQNCDIGTVYFMATHLLRNKIPYNGDKPYGARALSYTLLGDGNIQLCQPKKY
jgi:hypothetical protein